MDSLPIVGRPFPDFSLPAAVPQAGGKPIQSTLALADFAGRGLILFVYPKDATCDCSLVARDFRDLHAEFEQANVAIAGLSRDSIGAHLKWSEKEDFPFPLLADSRRETLKSWELIVPGTMYGKPVTKVPRTTFLIDESGILRRVWQKVTPVGHAEEVLSAVRSIKVL